MFLLFVRFPLSFIVTFAYARGFSSDVVGVLSNAPISLSMSPGQIFLTFIFCHFAPTLLEWQLPVGLVSPRTLSIFPV